MTSRAPLRRSVVAGVASLAGIAALAPAVHAASVPVLTVPSPPVTALSTPLVSGLSWRSGAKWPSCLAALRGRKADVNHVHITHRSFPAMAAQTEGHWVRLEAKRAPLFLVSLPLLTDDTKGQFARCATGAFDASFQRVGAGLKASGAQGVVVRLGFEANIGSGAHPWGVDDAAQVPAYKACWRRAALAIKAGGPGIAVEWTNAKRTGNLALRVLDMNPGDDVVDLWGVHYYDSGPSKRTQRLWDAYYGATYNGGPWGLGSWLAAAKAHGKRLGIGEWGVWQQGGSSAAADNPVYVDNMYRFFRDHAADVAYDSYQNSQPVHWLCPASPFSRAALRYAANWKAGR